MPKSQQVGSKMPNNLHNHSSNLINSQIAHNNAFDALHFHPAIRSHYIGSDLYERKWLHCMQELQDLKETYNQQQNSDSYEVEKIEEEEDSYEKNYPPNYQVFQFAQIN
jgi:hypothetical protein